MPKTKKNKTTKSRKKKGDFWKNVAVFLITALICFLILELMMYFFMPQKTAYYRKSILTPTFQYGDLKPVENQPNLAIRNFQALYDEYNVNISTDSMGFRRESTDLDAPTVLVFGDSQTFGLGVTDGEPYSNVLDSYYPKCQVINAGVPGTGLNYYYVYLKELIDAGEFSDIRQVIIGVNIPGNDWYGFMSSGLDLELDSYKPLILSEDGIIISKSGVPTLKQRINLYLTYSQLHQFMKHRMGPTLKAKYQGWLFSVNPEKKKAKEAYDDEITGYANEVIIKIADLAEENNIPIRFVFLPERPRYFNNMPQYVGDIKQSMRDNRIGYFDLSPSMSKEFERFEDYWLPVDGHYNPSGHKFMANRLYEKGVIRCG